MMIGAMIKPGASHNYILYMGSTAQLHLCKINITLENEDEEVEWGHKEKDKSSKRKKERFKSLF